MCKDAVIGDGTSWFSLCSHKPEAGDSSHASPSCYMALAKAHPVSGLRTLILEKRREGGLGQRESLCYGHTHTQAPPSSSTLRDGQTLTPHHTHTHTSHGHRPMHTHTSYRHTHHRPLGGHHQPHLHYRPPLHYVNSLCPPVSPAITYLILGY